MSGVSGLGFVVGRILPAPSTLAQTPYSPPSLPRAVKLPGLGHLLFEQQRTREGSCFLSAVHIQGRGRTGEGGAPPPPGLVTGKRTAVPGPQLPRRCDLLLCPFEAAAGRGTPSSVPLDPRICPPSLPPERPSPGSHRSVCSASGVHFGRSVTPGTLRHPDIREQARPSGVEGARLGVRLVLRVCGADLCVCVFGGVCMCKCLRTRAWGWVHLYLCVLCVCVFARWDW